MKQNKIFNLGSPLERLLIVGGSGLLGANWAKLKLEMSHVICTKNISDVPLDGVEVHQIDFTSISSIRSAFVDLQPDVVVNTAGLTSVEICESHIDLAFFLNVKIAERIACVCDGLGIPLVHISQPTIFMMALKLTVMRQTRQTR